MKRRLITIFLVVIAALICFPVLMVVAGSIKDADELRTLLLPLFTDSLELIHFRLIANYPTLKNFGELLIYTPQFYVVFWNSIKIVFSILILQLIIAVPGAWGFARFRFKGKNILFNLYIILMLMPFQVTMLSQYLVIDRIKMMDTQWAVILPAAFSTFPIFLIYRGYCSIPTNLVEAARIDGANEWMVFRYIALPLGSSGILSAMVLGFLEYWNLMEQPLAFLKDKTLWPLSLYLPEVTTTQAGVVLAASVKTLIPATLVFVMGQDYLEKGIIASALKE